MIGALLLVQQRTIDGLEKRVDNADGTKRSLDASGAVSVKSHGAVGNGTTDDSAAIQAAIDSLASPAGGAVLLPPGSYRLDSGLKWSDKPVRLVGAGSGVQPAAGTRLTVAEGVTAVTMQNGPSGLGAYSSVENIHIVGRDADAGTNNGVRLQCSHCQIRNVHVEGFGGANVHILSGNPADIAINANTWHLESLRSSNGKSHGFELQGVDSNAGTAVNIDADSNAGWGVFDNGFLGNTYLGPHFSGNREGAIRVGNIARAKRFYGVYKETDGRTAVQFDAGGAGHNFVDFLQNDEPQEFVDNTESKKNVVESPNR